ncbi:MAG: hypothetical protein BGO41_09210 [Clostridiales bacterium 38-18]|nr:MAG: hypothetical protein BGO41_09210 [Clostridiales bacterium 38-18]
MLEIGKVQTAYVNRVSEQGVYLTEQKDGEVEALLQKGFYKVEPEIDASIEVFIYKDSEQKLIATTKKPLLQLGEIGMLSVVGSIPNAYFLDLGIEKDLFLPNNEAKGKLQKGRKVLVKLIKDSNEQLLATMKIYNHLTEGTHIKTGEHVKGVVYEIKDEMGAFVAIDGKYHGFIPKHELYKEIKVGAELEARVTRVREDGKINLSIKEKSAVQVHQDVDILMKALTENDGQLYLNDESEPEVIKKRLNMSKKAFKRAVGRLLKEGKLQIFEDGIRLIK